ncbi:adenylate/guanylate cyclase domain-containing protein, partial [Nocardioides sp.]|uniref:adenylate/guanylate cyclase domain-containing protein n=1 Tax=Nocardioides sp. TaxID=35761 RepID=UPI002732EEE7
SVGEGHLRRRVRVQVLLTALLLVANLIGAAVVIVLISVVIPGPSILELRFWKVNFIGVPVYVTAAFLIGTTWGTRRALRGLRWSVRGDDAAPADQVATLAMPWRLTVIQFILWFGAFVVFTTWYGVLAPETIPKVSFTIIFGGVVVCANSYLLTEFALRPIAARALEAGPPRRRVSAGVVGRSVLAWLLGSGVPVAGLMLVALFSFAQDVTARRLAVAVLVLGGTTLVFGLLLNLLTTLSTVAPIRTVRQALKSVESGELDTEVVVFDGTELGELQSGFNHMAQGLRDREQLRDLFGRHVGREVAKAALEQIPTLGGEERDVAVIFVDIVGSTAMAATRPPIEVVELLNRFFEVIVDEVDRGEGFVNKFQGDAALAVFGAPVTLDDPAGHALAAARAISTRLRAEIPGCEVGVGVASGRAVAGNVGAHERFEYTVIGDPVNEAARLCDLAKAEPGGLLASDRALAAACEEEAGHWQLGEEVTLRGRTEPTRLAVPTATPGPASSP